MEIGDNVIQKGSSSIKGKIIAIRKGKVTLEIERGRITGIPIHTLEIDVNNKTPTRNYKFWPVRLS